MSDIIDTSSPSYRHRLLELAVGHHGHVGHAQDVLATANLFHGFIANASAPARGRPRKEAPATTSQPDPPTESSAAESTLDTDADDAAGDGFLDDLEEPKKNEPKVLKIEDVRAALLALQQRSDAKTARALLMKESGGADTLGKVKPESFAGIIKAAAAWKKPAA